uniref:Uncharacterized protein n=1 Tax=Arundo donax TaxID=35708 RepID=A0A0A8ZXU5_ARUDO
MPSLLPLAVEHAMIKRPSNVPEKMLHCRAVILPRLLQEPAHKVYCKCDIRLRVHQVTKSYHNAAVLCRVHQGTLTVLAQLQPRLHGHCTDIAAGHATPLHKLRSICSLPNTDAFLCLFKPEVVRQ